MGTILKKRIWILVCGLWFVGFGALAGCNPSATHKKVSIPSSITLSSGITPGQAITPAYGPFNGTSTGLACTYVPYLFLALGTPMPSSSFANIYETNVPGIGVKIWTNFLKTTYVGNTPSYWYRSNTAYATAYLTGVYIRFYAIAPLSSGIITLPQPLVKAMTSSSSGSLSADTKVYNYLSVNNDTNVTVPTCSLDTASKNQTVNLPKVNKSKFSGVGSVTGTMPFSMKLNCEAGVSVYATITDVNDLGNAGPNLTLDSTSTATGVGVQILANGSSTPSSFGSDNQFHLFKNTATTETNHTIPFQARYVQTESSISAGVVGAKATILFNYL